MAERGRKSTEIYGLPPGRSSFHTSARGAARRQAEVVADDERDGAVRLTDSTNEVGEQGGARRGGANGGKRWDQEECGTAKHGPDQSRAAVSQAQGRIREAITRSKKERLTALLHHVSIDCLRWAFFNLKRRAAPGVDEVTCDQYAENLEANLADLHARVKVPFQTRRSPRRCAIAAYAPSQSANTIAQ